MTLLYRVTVEMLILAAVAPLLVLALGRGRWHRAGLLGHPAVGMVAFNGTLLAGLAPPAVQAASRSLALGTLAQIVFLGAALSFWWPILRPRAEGGLTPIGRIGYLLIAGVPVTIPGVLLAFSRHPLYPGAQDSGALGLTPLDDQQLAGLVLFGTAKAILVTLTLVTLWRMLAASDAPPDDGWSEGAADRPPPQAPGWFRRLEEDLPAEPAAPLRPAARGTPSGSWARGTGLPPPPGGRARTAPAARPR